MQHTEEQRMTQRSVRQIAKEKVAVRATEIDETDQYPWDLFNIFAQQEWLGLSVPQAYGGIEASKVTFCLVAEELAKVSLTACGIVTSQELGLTPIVVAGNEEQKQKYLPKIATGEYITAFGLTEPGAGSDSAAMGSKAKFNNDHYILNGDKCFITNGDIAHIFTVFAKTDPEAKGVRGISAFIVEGNTPGLVRGKKERKMGVHGLGTTQLFFEDCAVPHGNLLGEEGNGFRIAMRTLDLTRTTIAAQAVGVAQGALDYAVEYAKQRIQFGKPIAALQGIQFLIAERAMEVEAARQLCHHAASLIDEDSPEINRVGAMAKCFASDVAMRTTVDAVQVMGGYGYMKDYPLERMMRDAKITQIWEGTNQIQRMVIARDLLG